MQDLLIPLRGLQLPLTWIKELEQDHQGKVILNERFNDALEGLLKRLKKRNPSMDIKSFNSHHFPGEEFIPVEIAIDPFGLGTDYRSGYHVFLRRPKVFSVAKPGSN